MKTKITSLILAGLFAIAAQAAVITMPSGLSHGDQYRIVFVTSTTIQATSSDISTYNAHVTAAAALNSDLNTFAGTIEQTTTWTAIASTATVDAIDNTSTTGTGVGIYLLNDTLFASNYTALWGANITNPLQIDESGNNVGNLAVWTGSTTSGTEDVDSLGDSIVNYGSTRFSNIITPASYWISRNFSSANTTELPLYAISGILTVPEPSSTALLGLGLSSLLLRRRRA